MSATVEQPAAALAPAADAAAAPAANKEQQNEDGGAAVTTGGKTSPNQGRQGPRPGRGRRNMRPNRRDNNNNAGGEGGGEGRRPRRSPSLENYRRVERPRGTTPDDEIRITSVGPFGRYITYAEKLLGEQERRGFTIRATGMAISVAVAVAEAMKRRFKGLHQMTTIQWTEVVDEYEPLVEGLPPRVEKRSVPSLAILLTLDVDECDVKSGSYQPPLDESEVVGPEAADDLAISGLRKLRNRNTRRGGGPMGRRRRSQSKEGATTDAKPTSSSEGKDGANDNAEGKTDRPRRNNLRYRRRPRKSENAGPGGGAATPGEGGAAPSTETAAAGGSNNASTAPVS